MQYIPFVHFAKDFLEDVITKAQKRSYCMAHYMHYIETQVQYVKKVYTALCNYIMSVVVLIILCIISIIIVVGVISIIMYQL